jgi:hypothetical protein
MILPPLVFPAETITQITLYSITLMRLDPSWLIQAVLFSNVCREKGLFTNLVGWHAGAVSFPPE